MNDRVFCAESLDELQALAINSFKDVKNKNLVKVQYPADPYGESKRKVRRLVDPFRKRYDCSFEDDLLRCACQRTPSRDHQLGHTRPEGLVLLPCKSRASSYADDTLDFFQPESYMSHLIGHEGDGSLLSYLKILGLASELFSGEKNSSPGFNFFTVDIELTIEGLRKLLTHSYRSSSRPSISLA